MAGYIGFTPNVRLSGDIPTAQLLLPTARNILQTMGRILALTETPTYSITEYVGDSIITVGIAGTTSRIDIYSPEPPSLEDPHPLDLLDVESRFSMKYLSGAVRRGVVGDETMPDGSTARVAREFRPTRMCSLETGIPLGSYQPNSMLDVPPGRGEQQNDPLSGQEYTQYRYVMASQYSGKMRKIVQALLGLGKQSGAFTKKPHSSVPSGASQVGFQVKYGYRSFTSHGVYTDPYGEDWLVEIGYRGVLAMKMPKLDLEIMPDYGTTAREVIEELGYMPSGGTFPSDIRRAVAEGRVLVLADPDEVSPAISEHHPISPEWGWSFSPGGGEAYIASVRVGPDGHQYSKLFRIDIRISRSDDGYRGDARLVEVMEGYLWAPNIPSLGWSGMIPFKYDLPGVGMVNHDASPLTPGDPQKRTCDAPLYATHIDGELHVVKFHRTLNVPPLQDRNFDSRVGDSPLIDGGWSWSSWSGYLGVPPMTYTSIFDHRRELDGSHTYGTFSSVPIGYSGPLISDMIQYPTFAWVRRQRYFKEEFEEVTIQNPRLEAITCIPSGDSEAYLYSYSTGGTPTRTRRYTRLAALTDPHQYYTVRCLGFVSMNPTPFDPNQCGMKCIDLISYHGPQYHTDRKVIGHFLAAGSPYADNGSWLDICQSVDNIPDSTPYLKEVSEYEEVGEVTFEAYKALVVSGGDAKLAPISGNEWAMISEFSPNPVSGEVHQFMWALGNCLGTPGGWISPNPMGGSMLYGDNAFCRSINSRPQTLIGFVE